METFLDATQHPQRLQRLASARLERLGAQVDPLRKLIRRRNEQLDRVVVRLRQLQSMRRAGQTGAASVAD